MNVAACESDWLFSVLLSAVRRVDVFDGCSDGVTLAGAGTASQIDEQITQRVPSWDSIVTVDAARANALQLGLPIKGKLFQPFLTTIIFQISLSTWASDEIAQTLQ